VVKRKDFNATLKQLTDCLERMCSGSRFHSDGAATANERAPNFIVCFFLKERLVNCFRANFMNIEIADV